jgi:hypothetical protein
MSESFILKRLTLNDYHKVMLKAKKRYILPVLGLKYF